MSRGATTSLGDGDNGIGRYEGTGRRVGRQRPSVAICAAWRCAPAAVANDVSSATVSYVRACLGSGWRGLLRRWCGCCLALLVEQAVMRSALSGREHADAVASHFDAEPSANEV
jgi:hypothetical protein